MKNKKPLKDRLALVTGASRGIGRAVALALAEGAHVIVAARTNGALEELDDEIRKAGGKATILKLDLRQGDKIDQLGPTLYQRWGKLDIFVGNAGILGPLSPLPHVTADAWNEVIDINLNANWRLIRTLDPLLKRVGRGARDLRHLRRRDRRVRLLGPLRGVEGRPRGAGPDLRARARRHERARQPRRSRARCARPCAPRPSPARIRRRCRRPTTLVPLFVELASPECDYSGRVVNFGDWKKQHARAEADHPLSTRKPKLPRPIRDSAPECEALSPARALSLDTLGIESARPQSNSMTMPS